MNFAATDATAAENAIGRGQVASILAEVDRLASLQRCQVTIDWWLGEIVLRFEDVTPVELTPLWAAETEAEFFQAIRRIPRRRRLVVLYQFYVQSSRIVGLHQVWARNAVCENYLPFTADERRWMGIWLTEMGQGGLAARLRRTAAQRRSERRMAVRSTAGPLRYSRRQFLLNL